MPSSGQGWKNTNTYRANTGVRSCSPEHERTRTRIFQKILNTNEHELGKFINYRTRTNTNTKLKVGEQRTRNRTPNTWTPNVFAPVRRVRRLKTVRTFRRSDCVKSPRFAQIYSWNPKGSLCSLWMMFDLFSLLALFVILKKGCSERRTTQWINDRYFWPTLHQNYSQLQKRLG